MHPRNSAESGREEATQTTQRFGQGCMARQARDRRQACYACYVPVEDGDGATVGPWLESKRAEGGEATTSTTHGTCSGRNARPTQRKIMNAPSQLSNVPRTSRARRIQPDTARAAVERGRMFPDSNLVMRSLTSTTFCSSSAKLYQDSAKFGPLRPDLARFGRQLSSVHAIVRPPASHATEAGPSAPTPQSVRWPTAPHAALVRDLVGHVLRLHKRTAASTSRAPPPSPAPTIFHRRVAQRAWRTRPFADRQLCLPAISLCVTSAALEMPL